MISEIIKSVEGRVSPEQGQVSVYWPNIDCTNVYPDSFDTDSIKDDLWGGEYISPEIIAV